MKRLIITALVCATMLTGCGATLSAVPPLTAATASTAALTTTATTTTVVTTTTTTAPPTTTAPTATAMTRPRLNATPLFPEMEAEVLRLMNEYRAAEGVAPLTMEYDYYDCAVTRASECLVLWSHTRPDGRKSSTVYGDFGLTAGVQLAGENLAKGFSDYVAIVEALMESPGHRRNILREEYDGVAIAILPIEGEELYAMSQLFIKKRAS